MNKIESLKKTRLFSSLKPAELKSLASLCVEHPLQKDQMLFQAGDPCRGLFVIASGSVRAVRENQQGREQVIHIEKAGATIAEVPVFDDQPYPSTVIAEEDSVVLFLSKENVRKLCLQYPAIALSALRLLAARLRQTAALVESIALKGVDQRLASWLWEEFREKQVKSFLLPSTSTLAARLGSVREVVSRSLGKLEKKGLIAVDRQRRVTLLNASALEDYVEA